MTTLRSGLNLFQFPVGRYVRVLTRETGHGLNTHRSNRAKNGLYHGKDIRSGNTISFSHHRCKRKWYPNVINKKVWSESLNDWVRFQMTTAALKGIDYEGGIDNYILGLDERSVQDSNYIQKIRRIIGTAKYLQGTLDEKSIKRLGFRESPPTDFPKKEEYNREKPAYVPIAEKTDEHRRIRKMKDSWVEPRYF